MLQGILKKALDKNNLDLSKEQQAKLIEYLTLIQLWNRVYNLTSILDPTEMVYLHLIDSLLIAEHLTGHRFLDVGSGAGLPGIPLAIMHPEQEWVLLDKNSKKTRFLTQVVAELGLKNVTVIHSRVEDFKPTINFDGILSRALSTIKVFVESTNHLLNDHGVWLAMKGKYPEEELLELPSGFKVKERLALTLKGMTVERHLICLGK